MNKRLLSFSLISTLAFFVFMSTSYSNRNFAPAGRTNAPGENNCASSGCHSTFGLQENLQSRITITVDNVDMDENFTYTPGTTYDMKFLINMAKARNGFSLTILNENGDFVGDISTSSNDATVSTLNGKKYIGHTNSSGVTFWDFQWTAPADSQVLTVYSIANLADNNMSPNGDSILSKTFSFTSIPDTTQTGIFNAALTENVQIINTGNQNGANFNITVDEVKYFTCEVFDLSGRQVALEEYLLHTGKQNISIPMDTEKGLYFLKLSSKGRSSTYKFMN